MLSLLLLPILAILNSVQCQSSGPSCSISDSQTISCSLASDNVDSCCVNTPGGLMLLTQFWNAHPSFGPADSWTIHGLWADYCGGDGFPKQCSRDRAYSASQLKGWVSQNATLRAYMERYWKQNKGNDPDLWQHEWDHHGTCMSTLEPKCYPPGQYERGDEAIEYFQQTVALFQNLDTFSFLDNCGITPSNTRTYTSQEIEDCLTAAFGATPYIGCRGGKLTEAWYYYHVQGSLVGGNYLQTDSTANSGCPSRGIRYLPK